MRIHHKPVLGCVLAAAAGLAGCGGGDSGFEPFVAKQVAAVDPVLTDSEADLALTDPDVALSTVLVGLQVGINLYGPHYLEFAPLAATGTLHCNAGTLDQIGADTDFDIGAHQCDLDGNPETIQDGAIGLHADSTGGSLSFGGTIDSYLLAVESGAGFAVLQVRGDLDFTTPSGGPDVTTGTGVEVVIGRVQPLPATGPLTPQAYFEVLAGNSTAQFEIDTNAPTGEIGIFGGMGVRGAGLAAPCDFRGAVALNTSDLMTLIRSGGVTFPTSGAVTLTAGAETATVTFDASGNAHVVASGGTTQDYTKSQVTGHCGFAI